MRAEGDAAVAVGVLAGHAERAPAGTGREDHTLRLQRGTVLEAHGDRAPGGHRRFEFDGPLARHPLDLVVADMAFEVGREARSLGLRDRDVVLDRQCVERLTAEALGRDAGADALARGVDRGRGTGRPAAHDQHVERRLFGERLGAPLGCPGVKAGDDFLERHASRAEGLAVHVDRRHGHDAAGLGLAGVERTVDGQVPNARVQCGNRVEGLHHVRTVVAGEVHPRLDHDVAIECASSIERGRVGLGRVPAHVQKREHERGEFVPERHRGEGHTDVLALARDLHLWPAGRRAVGAQAELGRKRHDRFGERAQFGACGGIIEREDQFDRHLQVVEIGAQLVAQRHIKHDRSGWGTGLGTKTGPAGPVVAEAAGR